MRRSKTLKPQKLRGGAAEKLRVDDQNFEVKALIFI